MGQSQKEPDKVIQGLNSPEMVHMEPEQYRIGQYTVSTGTRQSRQVLTQSRQSQSEIHTEFNQALSFGSGSGSGLVFVWILVLVWP